MDHADKVLVSLNGNPFKLCLFNICFIKTTMVTRRGVLSPLLMDKQTKNEKWHIKKLINIIKNRSFCADNYFFSSKNIKKDSSII